MDLKIDEAVIRACGLNIFQCLSDAQTSNAPFPRMFWDWPMNNLLIQLGVDKNLESFSPSSVTDEALFGLRTFCAKHTYHAEIFIHPLCFENRIVVSVKEVRDDGVWILGQGEEETVTMAICRAIVACAERIEGKDTKNK